MNFLASCMILTRPAKGIDAITCLALSWMCPMLQHSSMPRNERVLGVDGELKEFLARGEIPAAPFLPHLIQMYFSLRMGEVGQSRVNTDKLHQIHQLHQPLELNTDNFHLSIYIRGPTLPFPCCHFKSAYVRCRPPA